MFAASLQNLQARTLQSVAVQAKTWWQLFDIGPSFTSFNLQEEQQGGAEPECVLQPARQSSPSQMMFGDVRGEIGSVSCSSQ